MSPDTVGRILDALGEYPENYDEVFWAVHDRIRESGEGRKLDLAALICWKRSGQGRCVSDLMRIPDERVRKITRRAFAASADQQRLDELSPLPGFVRKYAIATAVLTAYDPAEFGVLDRRALQALERVGRPVSLGRGVTLRYLERVRELRDIVRVVRPDITARNIDQALWVIGKPGEAAPG